MFSFFLLTDTANGENVDAGVVANEKYRGIANLYLILRKFLQAWTSMLVYLLYIL